MKFENIGVYNIENAMRGMRNPMSGAFNSDTHESFNMPGGAVVGNKDHELAIRLIKAGVPHRKFLRQIFVSVDIVAPAYWWQEMDTYKIGTTRDSSSFMHKGVAKPFDISDFEVDDDIARVLTPYEAPDKKYHITYPYETKEFKIFKSKKGREYKIFKNGRVFSCPYCQKRHMSDGSIRLVEKDEREMNPAQANTGYFHLFIDGTFFYLHRLVAEVWNRKMLGECVVDHIDGNKGNNCVENLEWVTRSENDKRKIKNGLAPFWGSLQHKYLQYKANNIPEQTRRDIREMYEATHKTYKDIASIFSISETRVSDIIEGTDVVDKGRNELFEMAEFWERRINGLNKIRELYLDTKDDVYFRSIRRLLPMAYRYLSTWTGSYENLRNIYEWRRNHRLPEWRQFCTEFIEKLPYSEFITEGLKDNV